MSHDRAYLFVNPHAHSDNGKLSDGLEGFARTFLGFSFFCAGRLTGYSPETEVWRDAYLEGFRNGSDPTHPGFWGAIQSPQLLVECASLALGLMVSGPTFWSRLSPKSRNNLLDLFRANSQRRFLESNWLWFRILHNLALENLGGEDRRVAILADINLLGGMYRGDGWYYDGLPQDGYRHLDYYNAYAMHFYGLLFAWLQEGRYKVVADELRSRARLFFTDYQHLFAPDAHPPVFGRSMIYRFATIAPWGMGFLTECCDVPADQVSRICIDTVNAYLANGCVQSSGRLGLGVYEEQLFIRESYSGGGSPYWAFKAFSLLLLPENHGFWSRGSDRRTVEPDGVYPLAGGDMYSVKQHSHIILVNPGLTHKWHGDKYNRFAYSNRHLATLGAAFPVDNMMLVRRIGTRHWSHRSYVQGHPSPDTGKTVVWRASYDDRIDIRTTLAPIPWGYFARHCLEGDVEVEFAVGGLPVVTGDGVRRLSTDHDSLCGFAGPTGWTALLLLSNGALRGLYYPSSKGIGFSRVVVPYFAGYLGGSRSRELGVAVLAGRDFSTMDAVIREVRSMYRRLECFEVPGTASFGCRSGLSGSDRHISDASSAQSDAESNRNA